MVALLVVLFRLFLSRDLLDEAKKQANKGIAGRMEGHAKMDMSVGGDGTLCQRITSAQGFTAISHYFVMDWASVWMASPVACLFPERSPPGYRPNYGSRFSASTTR